MVDRSSPARLVLLTGAGGYVGGRLLQALSARGERLRCLARRPEFLVGRAGARTELAKGDVLDTASLAAALRGVATAYYLVYSMGSSGSFEEEDRRAALNFARAAREAGVSRIVYFGGLGRAESLSRHLASRQEVGRILRDSGVPHARPSTSGRAASVPPSRGPWPTRIESSPKHVGPMRSPHWGPREAGAGCA